MTISGIPGVRPSPFDPTPWPPWDRVAAAGLGEFYGGLVRQLDAEPAVDGFDATKWATDKLAAAQQQGTITANDVRRLTALINPTTDAPDVSKLFDEAMDDPDASPAAVAMLSIAKYKAEHGPATDDKVRAYAGAAAGLYLVALGPVGLGIFVAVEVAEHVDATVTWR